MAAITFENQPTAIIRSRIDWGAIWAGVFTFVGIWSVFGLLGVAIFASSASPEAAHPITGMGLGMSIWAIVLTIIAMYVAGRETGRLAAVTNRHDGVLHGMAMFGLTLVAALIIIVVGGNGIATTTTASPHNPYFLDVVSGLGWAGFLSVFLGWLAAMGGASSGAKQIPTSEKTVQPIRNAA
ncbi:MAG TPA: hypothetical protein VHW45_02240 [Candidatus Sulfotelmatobacter sp.]|nr:hypothetical protein [Candidatus Sulfotelmatobacter sp.]